MCENQECASCHTSRDSTKKHRCAKGRLHGRAAHGAREMARKRPTPLLTSSQDNQQVHNMEEEPIREIPLDGSAKSASIEPPVRLLAVDEESLPSNFDPNQMDEIPSVNETALPTKKVHLIRTAGEAAETGRVVIALDDIGEKIERAFALRPRDVPWAELPRMREISFEYSEIDKFLHDIESFVQIYLPGKDLMEVLMRQMAPSVRDYYREHFMDEYGTDQMDYQRLVRLMGALTNVRDPEEYLEEALNKFKPGQLNPQALRMAISKEISTYRRMCRRLQVEADQAAPRRVLRVYLRLLHPAIRSQLIPVMSNKEMEDIAKVEKLATQIFKAQGELEEFEKEARERKRSWESEERNGGTRRRFANETNPNAIPLGGGDSGAPPTPRNRPGNSGGFRNRNSGYRGNNRRVMTVSSDPLPETQVNVAGVNAMPKAATQVEGAPLPPSRTNASAGLTCFSCGERNHGLRDCPKFSAECKQDPERKKRCAGCNTAGLCTAECPRRQYFAKLPGEYIELSRYGRSHYCRKDRLPDWYRQDLYVGKAAGPENKVSMVSVGTEGSNSTVSTPRCNLVATSPVSSVMINSKELNTKESKEDKNSTVEHNKGTEGDPCENTGGFELRKRDGNAPSLRQLVNLLTNKAVSDEEASKLPKVQTLMGRCMRATINKEENVEMMGKHLRTIGYVDGQRKVLIIDTGADVSLLGKGCIQDSTKIQKLDRIDGQVSGIGGPGDVAGKIIAEVKVGPVKARWEFYVCLEPGFEVILGANFIYSHMMGLSPSMHSLVCEGHDGALIPLLGTCPVAEHSCRVREDVVLSYGTNFVPIIMCRTPPPPDGKITKADQLLPEFEEDDEKEGGAFDGVVPQIEIPELKLSIPAQLTRNGGYIAAEYWGSSPMYLAAGWIINKDPYEVTDKCKIRKGWDGCPQATDLEVMCRMISLKLRRDTLDLATPQPTKRRKQMPKEGKVSRQGEDQYHYIMIPSLSVSAANAEKPRIVQVEAERCSIYAGHEFWLAMPETSQTLHTKASEEETIQELTNRFAALFKRDLTK